MPQFISRFRQLLALPDAENDVKKHTAAAIENGVIDARSAILAADAVGPVILSGGTYVLASSTTLTNRIIFTNGAKLKPAAGTTLTLSDGFEAHDDSQIFDISAAPTAIAISNQSHVTTKHFGCTGTNDTSKFTFAAITASNAAIPLLVKTALGLTDLVAPIAYPPALELIGVNQPTITGPGTDTYLFEVAADSGASINARGLNFEDFFTVYNMQGNDGEDPYSISLSEINCINFGAGLIGSGGGVFVKLTTCNIDKILIVDGGLDLTTTKAFGINLSILEAGSINISKVFIDGIGSVSNTDNAGGIHVDCTESADKFQNVVVTECHVKNIFSETDGTGGHATDQVFGIMVLEAAVTINTCTVDTIVCVAHSSNPDGIYVKGRKFIITNCRLLDILGKEGIINVKGGNDDPQVSIGGVIAHNYIGFRTTNTSACNGIDIAVPEVYCFDNTIEECNIGVVASQDNTTIKDNTFRRCIRPVSIIVGYDDDPAIRVVDNEYIDCGDASTVDTYQCTLEMGAATQTMRYFEYSGNVSIGQLALTNKWGFRSNAGGFSCTIDRMVIKDNDFGSCGLPIQITAGGGTTIGAIEVHDNSASDAISVDHFFNGPTTTMSNVSIKGNIMNGAPYVRNYDSCVSNATDLADVTAKINVWGKYLGKPANDSVTPVVYATGSAAADDWVDATGAVVYSPV